MPALGTPRGASFSVKLLGLPDSFESAACKPEWRTIVAVYAVWGEVPTQGGLTLVSSKDEAVLPRCEAVSATRQSLRSPVHNEGPLR